jgi:hypothetical protein
VPAYSPALVEKYGPFTSPEMFRRVPRIHDESLASRAAAPSWANWVVTAGMRDADVSRGLRFSSADHALDATVEGAGVLLAFDALAYNDLRTGGLVMPSAPTLPLGALLLIHLPEEPTRVRECEGPSARGSGKRSLRVVTGTWLWSNESRKAWLVFRPRSPPANSETLRL